MASIRAFVAIYLEPAQRAMVAFRDGIRRDLPHDGCRWTKDEQLHLTLRFIGELPAECLGKLVGRLSESCRRSGALHLVARFEGEPWNSARVIAVAVRAEEDRLNVLQRKIEDDVRALGLLPEERPFQAHLTLARIDRAGLQPKLQPESGRRMGGK